MRARALAMLAALLVLGGILTDASPAEAPARASATAKLLGGTSGRAGVLSSRGDGRRSQPARANEGGVRIGGGEVLARTSRSGGSASARASAVARSVSIFDGLVTAYGVRRTATARGGGRLAYSGRVQGLEIDGRMIGDVATARVYDLPDDAGTVTVNTRGSGLVVRLRKAAGGQPAGAFVAVSSVSATAVDGADPAATPTPTPRPRPAGTPAPSATAKPERRAARRKRAPAARRRAPDVTRRLTAGRFAFPVFSREARTADDWGAARQIGAHQGNDVFAPFGAPVLAVTSGELFKVGTLPISGNRLWLRSKSGDEYFYAHLSAFSPAAVNGRKVKAGEVLGFTGNTGDAEPTPPHVHFEIHPGGGDAIDPHGILAAWQRKRDVVPGAWLARYGADTEQRPGALVEVRDFIAGE